jgi:hypothetical protein
MSVAGSGDAMVEFLGVPADRRLLDGELDGLAGLRPRPTVATTTAGHDRLVAAGSAMTAATLLGGTAMAIYGGQELLFGGGGTLAVVLTVIGILLAGTHWGWVHVAEYTGAGIDQRQERADRELTDLWLRTVAPYPRFAVTTSVLADASTSVERVLYRPVLTEAHTFTFAREADPAVTYDADTPAEVIAGTVERLRRETRLETDRAADLWEAASTAYAAALQDATGAEQRLAAQRAAATALSEHLNALLLEPPLVE